MNQRLQHSTETSCAAIKAEEVLPFNTINPKTLRIEPPAMAFHSKMSAQTKRIGRIHTALPTSGTPLYLTIRDPSNPDPNGGIILDTTNSTCSVNSKQSFVLVSVTNPSYGVKSGERRAQLRSGGSPCYMIVTENMDYRLRISDRRGFYQNRGYVLEAVQTSRREIEEGCTPAQEFVFTVEQVPSSQIQPQSQVTSQGSSCPFYRFVTVKDGCEVAIDSYVSSGESAVQGTHVLGYEASIEKQWQMWTFQYPI